MSVAPAPAGVKRDCVCPVARHEHGTTGGYGSDRCRCLECRAAAAAYWRRRHRLKAYGRFQPRFVDPTGTRRRVQALMTLGWSIKTQAQLIGVLPKQLTDGVTIRPVIFKSTAEKIARLYDELWNTPRVGACKAENVSIAMTKQRAVRGGYVPPLGWDDDCIDDPSAEPHRPMVRDRSGGIDEIAVEEAIRGRDVYLTLAERGEAVQRLTERGYPASEIARLLRTTKRSVVRRRARTAA